MPTWILSKNGRLLVNLNSRIAIEIIEIEGDGWVTIRSMDAPEPVFYLGRYDSYEEALGVALHVIFSDSALAVMPGGVDIELSKLLGETEKGPVSTTEEVEKTIRTP